MCSCCTSRRMLPSRIAGGRRFKMPAACAWRIFSGRIILNFGVQKRLRAFLYPFFTGGVWNELPQSKPDGFASSLGEGASGGTGRFALTPGTSPPCQRPHLRGGCRRRRLGEFPRQRLRGRARCRGTNPFRLAASRQATFPKGDGFRLCRKVSLLGKSSPFGGAGIAQR